MERFRTNNTNTDPFIKNIEDTNPAKFGHINAIVDQINNNSSSGTFTLVPDVTEGTGAVNDFIFDYIKVGGKVVLTFLCSNFVIATGEDSTAVQLDLTGTAAEPSANFASKNKNLFTGSVNPANYSWGADIVQIIAINTVTGTKKLRIVLVLEAIATGDFDTSIGGAITITI